MEYFVKNLGGEISPTSLLSVLCTLQSDHDDWERYFDNIFHQFYDDDQEAEKPIEKEISRDNITNRMVDDKLRKQTGPIF